MTAVSIDCEQYGRVPFYGNIVEWCHVCNALFGHYYHWGCDAEICPSCGGQMIGCVCLDIECPVIKPERPRRKVSTKLPLQR